MLEVPLSGPDVPVSLIRIDLEIFVAGRKFTHQVGGGQCPPPCLGSLIYVNETEQWKCGPPYGQGFGAGSQQISFPQGSSTDLRNQIYTFTWDGKDAYGRILQGVQPATVRIGYTYCGSYQKTDKFGYNRGGMITGSSASQEVTLWQTYRVDIGPWDVGPYRLGGWTLNVHHFYDPGGKVLHLGNGKRRNAAATGGVVSTVAGGGWKNIDNIPAREMEVRDVRGLVVAPNGGIYYSDPGKGVVCLIQPDGIVRYVAGLLWSSGYNGEGWATGRTLCSPRALALGRDGSYYIADACNHRIRRVAPNGWMTTIAGSGPGGSINYGGYGGDGGLATEARLFFPTGVALGPDGTL